MKRTTLFIAVAVLAVLGLGFLLSNPTNESNTSTTTPTNTETKDTVAQNQEETPNAEAVSGEGRYVDYSESAVSSQDYDTSILFFHAPWCPQCLAFERDINANQIPDGVQILKVDFDTSTELKAKHGVTLQTTFVSVNSNGEQLKKWVGYSEDKTLTRILEEFN